MVSKNGGAMPPVAIMLIVSIINVKPRQTRFWNKARTFLWPEGVLSCGRRREHAMLKFINSVVSFVLLAALAICAVPLVGFWGRSVHWSLDVASHFVLPSVIAACVLSVLAGLLLRAWTGAGALALAITTSLSVAPWTTQPRPATVAPAQSFKVLQFNVWYRNADAARVIETVRRSNADLVVLLEAVPSLRERLAVLADIYPHRLGCPDDAPCDVLVLSRVPLEARGVQRTNDAFRSPIMTLRATLAGCPVTVHAVHLARPFPFNAPEAQLSQARDVARIVSEGRGARLVAGDFNAAPWGRTMQAIIAPARLQLLPGAGGTWPVTLPRQMRIPIDHLAVGEGLSFLKREVLPRAGSDHAPVLASIGVTDASRCVAD